MRAPTEKMVLQSIVSSETFIISVFRMGTPNPQDVFHLWSVTIYTQLFPKFEIGNQGSLSDRCVSSVVGELRRKKQSGDELPNQLLTHWLNPATRLTVKNNLKFSFCGI